MRISIWHLSALLLGCSSIALADERPTAKDLLAAYEKAVVGMTSFHIEAVEKEWVKGTTRTEVKDNKDGFIGTRQYILYRDGFRWRTNEARRWFITLEGVHSERVSRTEYLHDEFLGEKQALRIHVTGRADDPVTNAPDLSLRGSMTDYQNMSHLGLTKVLFGYMRGDDGQPLWKIMREASTLELMPDRETIRGHSTYVVKSKGRFGTHTLWLDPEFGCLPRRIVIHKQGGDLFGNIQLGIEQVPPVPPDRAGVRRIAPERYTLVEVHERCTDIQIENKLGQFVITAFDRRQEPHLTFSDRVDRPQHHSEFRVQTVDFQPELWPKTAFQPTIEVPNETMVLTNDRAKRYVWRNGRIENN